MSFQGQEFPEAELRVGCAALLVADVPRLGCNPKPVNFFFCGVREVCCTAVWVPHHHIPGSPVALIFLLFAKLWATSGSSSWQIVWGRVSQRLCRLNYQMQLSYYVTPIKDLGTDPA